MSDLSAFEKLDRNQVLALKAPRYGNANPERIENAFWLAMIRDGQGGYFARQAYKLPLDSGTQRRLGPVAAWREHEDGGPVWCFDRFGQSETTLRDGSRVFVGGEHEDWYDPDFCIYNDVVVRRPDQAIEIFGYPAAVFPPTDFHSATRVGNALWLIGSVGYKDQRRYGETPVFRLDLTTFAIDRVPTHGDVPGWIGRHQAEYIRSENAIMLTGGTVAEDERTWTPNSDTFSLALDSGRWQLE